MLGSASPQKPIASKAATDAANGSPPFAKPSIAKPPVVRAVVPPPVVAPSRSRKILPPSTTETQVRWRLDLNLNPSPDTVPAETKPADDVEVQSGVHAIRPWVERQVAALGERLETRNPPWLVSLVIHLLLLLILGFVSFRAQAPTALLITLETREDSTDTEFTEIEINPLEMETPEFEEQTEVIEIAELETPQDVEIITPEFPEISPLMSVEDLQPAELVVLEELPVSQELVSDSSNAAPNDSTAPAGAPSMFAGRTGKEKQRLLKQSGGTEETENAVELGLQWLKRQQLSDGSWSMVEPYANPAREENSTAATSMALLAFMGAGHTHLSGAYQEEVRAGMRWLLGRQDATGWMAQDASMHQAMYAQGQATIVLCELLGMTRDTRLIEPAQRACNFAANAQSPQGGWRYRPRFDTDTSVTGWFLVALKSGKAAGLEVDDELFENTNKYLDTVGGDVYGGGYAYQPTRAPEPAMTGEAILCRQYLGWHRNMPGMRTDLADLVENHMINDRQPNVYYWYYATQAIHHFGGELWTKWNDRMKVQLPGSQVQAGREKGSWDPSFDAWGSRAGRLYQTCMTLYCLEVYYRHMPIYDLEKVDGRG